MFSVPTLSNGHTQTLSVICGAEHVVASAALAVAYVGFSVDSNSDIGLVIDAPLGFALHTLESQASLSPHIIVSTTNTCPEYVEDLWDYQPDALLAGQSLTQRLAEAVTRVDKGERYRLTPGSATLLTPVERQVLRCIARGWSNKRIACHQRVRTQSVANVLTRIYAGLGVRSREAAILYYWGIWNKI